MRYYIELIESYLRLHEQASPESEAQRLINETVASAPGTQIPVKGNIYLRLGLPKKQNGEEVAGNVTLFGLPGQSLVVQYGNKTQGKGYPKLIELLSGGDQEPTPGKPSEEEAAAGAGIPADGALGLVPEQTPYTLFKRGDLFTEKEYNDIKDQILASNKCKNRKTQICRDILDGFDKTKNSMGLPGAITKLIANLSEEYYCPEEIDCFHVRGDEGITDTKTLLAGVFEDAITILKKDKLTIADVKTLKDTISVDQGGKIMIGDPISGKMMVINEQVGLMDTIINTLAGNKLDPETGKPLSLKTDDADFLKKYRNKFKKSSITRGFFYEDLRIAAAFQIQYNITGDPRYAKLAAEAFEKSSVKAGEVIDALKSMMGQFVRAGGIAIDGNSDDERLMLDAVVQSFKLANPSEFLRTFTRMLNRFALAGLVERRPSNIMKSASEIGYGRKGDTRELYTSFKKADRALAKMGFKDPEMRASMIKKDAAASGDKKSHDQYYIFDSLKFSVDLEDIKAGESSAKNQVKVMDPETRRSDEHAKEHYNTLTKMGVSDNDLASVKSEIDRFKSDYNRINKLKTTYAYVSNSSGKMVKAPVRETFIKNVIDMIRENNDINDEVTSSLQIQLAKIIESNKNGMNSKGKDWEQIAAKIACVIQKKRMQLLYSKDKKKAVGMIATLGLFGGASSDNAMLTSADTKTGKVYVTNQNVALQRLRDALKDPESANIVFKNNDFIINGIQVHYDGDTATTYVPRSIIEECIKSGVGKEIEVFTKAATYASASIGDSKLLNVIEKQFKLLETLCHRLIEKDTKVP